MGVGQFVTRTVSFNDQLGEAQSGEILIRVLSHDEVTSALDVYPDVDKTDVTYDQYRKAILVKTVYESEKKPFFANVREVGLITTELLTVMYAAVDEVLDLSGKRWVNLMQTPNSGANLSSMELADAP